MVCGNFCPEEVALLKTFYRVDIFGGSGKTSLPPKNEHSIHDFIGK